MLVSFIIPAYNAADTIVRCLESIYGLSLKREEFEVIVIDDASTDNTVQIIENWRLKVENLTMLRQSENHRQGAARNRGVKVAKGEYICFVDADDAVTEGVVEAICLAKEKQTDMVAYHYVFVNEAGATTKEADKLSFADGQIFSGIEMQNKHPYWCSGPVAYIYSRAFLEYENYPFVEGVLYEDSDFVANHLYGAQRMAYSSEMGYLAYYREGSTTHSITHKNLADYLLLGTRMRVLYERVMNERVNELENEGIEKFAEGILEGATWNITKSLNRLYKLRGRKEIIAFYDRVDANIDRKLIYKDKRIYTYNQYWNILATIGIKYKLISILLNTYIGVLYKEFVKLRSKH